MRRRNVCKPFVMPDKDAGAQVQGDSTIVGVVCRGTENDVSPPGGQAERVSGAASGDRGQSSEAAGGRRRTAGQTRARWDGCRVHTQKVMKSGTALIEKPYSMDALSPRFEGSWMPKRNTQGRRKNFNFDAQSVPHLGTSAYTSCRCS